VPEFIRKGWNILLTYMKRADLPDSKIEHGPNGPYTVYTTRCEYQPTVIIGQTNIDMLTEQLKEARAEAEKLREEKKANAEILAEHPKLLAKVSRLEEAERGLINDLNVRADQYATMLKTKQKLEADIGRLRKALGELRMKEILEAPSS